MSPFPVDVGFYRAAAMYVCICNAVTDLEIRECIRLGATSLEQLSGQLGVATCCGKCAEHAYALIASARPAISGSRLAEA